MAPVLRGGRGRGRGNRSRGLPPLGPFTRSSSHSTILGSVATVSLSRPVTRSVGSADPSASTFVPNAPPSHVPRTTSDTHDDDMTTSSPRVPSESRPHTRSVDSTATTTGHTQLHTISRPFTRSVGPSSTTSARTGQSSPQPASSSDGQSVLHSGSTEVLSTSTSTRGRTIGKGTSIAAASSEGGKLPIQFDAKLCVPISEHAERFHNEIGFIMRSHAPHCFREWRLVPETTRASLRERLTKYFDIDLSDKVTRNAIDKQMGRVWRSTRYEYRKHFMKHKGLEDLAAAKRNCPRGIEQSDWEYLCDMFVDPTHLAKCAKNSESRKKRKWNPKNGSVSNARHHVRVGKDLDAPTGQIETFRDQHYSDETGWVGEDLEEKYEQMMQLRDVYSVEEMTDYDIMEQVLGRESVRLKGWGRIPSESSGATDATSRPLERVPSVFEQQLLEKVALLEGALSGVKDTLQSQQSTLQTQQSILHAHGLIPPSSAPDA